MSKWKLCRQTYGNEEFTIAEGDQVTIGRALSNTITLSSIVISRNHCVLKVQEHNVLITDLKSSNGVYIGHVKIPQNKPYMLRDSDIVGIGWAPEAPLADITNNEKFIFKLCKENNTPNICKRIMYQSENESDGIDKMLAVFDSNEALVSLKRKADNVHSHNIKLKTNKEKIPKMDVVNLLSDSDTELCNNQNEILNNNNIKLEPICEENYEGIKTESKNHIKYEKDSMEYEAFDVKQEYLGYEDEAIIIDSDSDGESEHWYLRLSQNSPGKPFIRKSQEMYDMKPDDSSYSQMEDDFISIPLNLDKDEEEEYLDDMITIPPEPADQTSEANKKSDEEYLDDIISLDINLVTEQQPEPVLVNDKPTSIDLITVSTDEVDAFSTSLIEKEVTKNAERNLFKPKLSPVKKTQIIDPLVIGQKLKRKYEPEKRTKISSPKHSKVKKHSSKKHITNSQKEERRKRLKEIAVKEKEGNQDVKNASTSSNKSSTSLNKSTSSDRGAFLTDSVQVVKPVLRKEEDKDNKNCLKSKSINGSPPQSVTDNKQSQGDKMSSVDDENRTKKSSKTQSNKSSHTKPCDSDKTNKIREPLKSLKTFESTEKSEDCKNKPHVSSKEGRVPLMSVKPRMESTETWSGKPFLKVVPVVSSPKKSKKTVSFSDAAPEIRTFEIEPGNKMKKTSLVKTTLVDTRQMPVFSLEKITLMKILRWNPHWLDEQKNNNEPPPILGHNNPPMSTFHAYANHHQYIHLVGDLLLMEIWESLSMAHMKNQSYSKSMLKMRIGSLPPIPTQERCYELFNISVDISVPSNGPKNIVPRVGEILLVSFGPDNLKTKRFFYVQNVRCLPSPPNNIHSYYSVSLHATFTDKMKSLRQGGEMLGITLACISNELNLFEAMEHLAGSPLSDAILKPGPQHFQRLCVPGYEINSNWTKALNPSQRTAVTCSVSAALGDTPSIQMVQGPPGTGKSSVICAMVMTYFHGEHSNKLPNRGKILICATSNAAVDELVLRLLKIRQSLPKAERFRMVRVGRVESMHSRARDVSSQQLAQRDAQRALSEPVPHPGLQEEISHLEAKVNMWKTQAQDAKDPVRVAYCQGRVSELVKRITLVKAGSGVGGSGELRPDQLFAAERKFIEGADIVLTTLASAHGHKMKGLKGRIALCIIDEAGQAIEPETLIPLTLDVTRLTLIGDPQQLPGYICSQRAKKHGLGESLFSRLTSSAEQWPQGNPVVLLNQQYRMHPHIADYPNRAFYGGKVLSTGPQRPPNLAMPPYAIVAISSGDRGQGASGANEMEACGVSRLVVALSAALRSHSQLSLAVITPYNAHKDLIKKHLKNLQDPSETPVEVNTVDSFQGQERDVVVVSLARSNGVGFLTNAGRMNVMLTRAKHALLIVLNPHAITKNPQWRTLIEDAQKRKMYKVLPNKMCQPGPIPNDILDYIQ